MHSSVPSTSPAPSVPNRTVDPTNSIWGSIHREDGNGKVPAAAWVPLGRHSWIPRHHRPGNPETPKPSPPWVRVGPLTGAYQKKKATLYPPAKTKETPKNVPKKYPFVPKNPPFVRSKPPTDLAGMDTPQMGAPHNAPTKDPFCQKPPGFPTYATLADPCVPKR